MLGSVPIVSDNGNSDERSIARDKVPLALNPHDPLNQFVYSVGGNDNFTTYPGLEGIPHRAKVARFIKESDPDYRRPISGGQVRCETYDLTDEKEKLAYQVVSSRVYSMARQGKALVCHVDRQFIAEKRGWVVYFEWIELFTYDPVNPREAGETHIGVLRRR